MITATEAKNITVASLSEPEAKLLMEEVEDRIRRVASEGRSSLTIKDDLSDAKKAYLRRMLTDQGFSITHVGLTIFW